MARLNRYRAKRNFKKTPEPSGRVARRPTKVGGLFVVHKHAARRLHYDLRLEHEGVLESWAVPKGPSRKPGEKHLAVHVEDHPLEYGEFEGVIPRNEYGGGTVMLWDRGHWRQTRRSAGRIDFELEGHKLRGAWTLTRMRADKNGSGKDNWLLIKRSDSDAAEGSPPPSGVAEDRSVATGRTMEEIARGEDAPADVGGTSGTQASKLPRARKRPLPPNPRPELATLVADAPPGDGWIHEIKFDGYRIMAAIGRGNVRLISRNGKDWTDRFPEIARQLEKLNVRAALLDGEVVSLSRDGTSSFRGLQEALSERRTASLVYQVFDLVHLDGHDLTDTPLIERKRALSDVLERAGFVGSATVRFTEHIVGEGPSFFDNACRLGLEGIISKRADARYRSERSRQWLKIKCSRHEELVVAGYTDPAGTRTGFGALLLGAYDGQGRLIYAGKVGTGFNQRQLESLARVLGNLETSRCPFESCAEKRAHWVRPELVAEVEFTEWTRDGMLRHPSFRGLREDKNPEDILMPQREPAAPAQRKTEPARSQGGRSNGMRPAGGRSRKAAADGGPPGVRPASDDRVAGVKLTNPDRVLYPDQGLTKLALARFYEEIADWILPQLRRRPLALVRCPRGRSNHCFFQKHPGQAMPADMPRINIREKAGKADYLYVEELRDLIGLVQAATLEFHVWGSRVDDHERPDIIVFDLDPGDGVTWQSVLDVARALRDRLDDLGLASFVRTTGGKGLHVLTPLEPQLGWDEVKAFARGVAEAHAADDKRLTVNMSKARRAGRIFLDYLRNGRGATAIASYSTRAREGAPVAVPVRWDELNAAMIGSRYNVANLRRRLNALKKDPWEDFEASRRPLNGRMLEAVGARPAKRR